MYVISMRGQIMSDLFKFYFCCCFLFIYLLHKNTHLSNVIIPVWVITRRMRSGIKIVDCGMYPQAT